MIELQGKIGSPPNQCKGLHSKIFDKLVSNSFLYAHSSGVFLSDLKSVSVCQSIDLFSKWKLGFFWRIYLYSVTLEITIVYFPASKKEKPHSKICHFLAIHHTMQHIHRHIRHLPLPTTGIQPVQNASFLSVFTKACVLWAISRFCGLQRITRRETMKHLMLVTDQAGLCESWHFFLVWQNVVHGEMLTNSRLLRLTKFPVKWETKLQIKHSLN